MNLPPDPSWPLSPDPLPTMTASELKAFRKEELKVTQATAAGLLGVSLDTLRAWEQGKYPVSQTAARLVDMWRQYVSFRQVVLAQNRETALEDRD